MITCTIENPSCVEHGDCDDSSNKTKKQGGRLLPRGASTGETSAVLLSMARCTCGMFDIASESKSTLILQVKYLNCFRDIPETTRNARS